MSSNSSWEFLDTIITSRSNGSKIDFQTLYQCNKKGNHKKTNCFYVIYFWQKLTKVDNKTLSIIIIPWYPLIPCNLNLLVLLCYIKTKTYPSKNKLERYSNCLDVYTWCLIYIVTVFLLLNIHQLQSLTTG